MLIQLLAENVGGVILQEILTNFNFLGESNALMQIREEKEKKMDNEEKNRLVA